MASELQIEGTDCRLMFMQSSGGLTAADLFQGKDAILSGPAGGVVGAVETSRMAGFDAVIGFDMGGTSTDVSHYNGDYERAFETEVAGVRMRAPMMMIHTVAAGGGSILHYRDGRFQVGPDSAGANPGPEEFGHGWIGMTDAVTENTWVWSDGEPVTYTNWKGGEPNNWLEGEEFCPGPEMIAQSFAELPGRFCSRVLLVFSGRRSG